MREIRFRGMDEHLNWVFGGFYIGATGNHIIAELGDIPPTWHEPGGDCRVNFVAVDPKTVGQLTGCQDFFGTDIYEGDIVFLDSKMMVGKIENDGISWRIQFEKDLDWLCDYFEDLHVIGNVHQNPELLSGD